MLNLTGKELRASFLNFFKDKEHLVLPSASLIPDNDPTLLLIGAGMAPFKPFFTGKLTPPNVRIATSQKCIRTGDIENVGRTARHHTFFEMLGNFSFGDYFKKESICWGWEYLTKVLQMPEDKLWATIYTDDDEAYDIWLNVIGLPPERIVRMKDNFWEIGPGPCGPCSEIYFDLGAQRGCSDPNCAVGCDCDRYLEIWNHVFTQFNKELDGSYTPLDKKNIDTGAGLERIASVLQRKKTNFETDLLFPILQYGAELSGVTYGKSDKTDVSLKVIADHARSITFMVGDGIMPSNEGRGYVLRRVLRRAVRHAKLLGIDKLFLAGAVDVVVDVFGEHYNQLREKQDFIKKVIQTEEERFKATLEQGIELLYSQIKQMQTDKKTVLDGNICFNLYDTFGFPWELTQEILAEHGFSMDKQAFDEAMQEQRQRARQARTGKDDVNVEPDFTGFNTAELKVDESITDTQIALLFDVSTGQQVDFVQQDKEAIVVLSVTPFHAEGGGQIGDTGTIISKTGAAKVKATKKIADGTTVHYVTITEGNLRKNDKITAATDNDKKLAVARNHTATHLLHSALKKVLGEHVNQAGSYVGPDRLRFDFSHFSPVSKEELAKIEFIVNKEILQAKAVTVLETTQDKARQMGAMALFGEKYGEIVRVVQVSDFSTELCGGTHVDNIAQIGLFKIIAESSVGAGLRRIEAVSGIEAIKAVQNQDKLVDGLCSSLKCRQEDLSGRLEATLAQIKDLQQEIVKLGNNLTALQSENVQDQIKAIGDIKASVLSVDTPDIEGLRNFGDKLKDKLGQNCVVVLFSKRTEDKLDLLVMVGKEALTKGLHAGNLVKQIAALVGGGGGGRADMAQAGGKQPQNIPYAIDKTWEIIESQIK